MPNSLCLGTATKFKVFAFLQFPKNDVLSFLTWLWMILEIEFLHYFFLRHFLSFGFRILDEFIFDDVIFVNARFDYSFVFLFLVLRVRIVVCRAVGQIVAYSVKCSVLYLNILKLLKLSVIFTLTVPCILMQYENFQITNFFDKIISLVIYFLLFCINIRPL